MSRITHQEIFAVRRAAALAAAEMLGITCPQADDVGQRIRAMQDRQTELLGMADAIRETASAANRDMNEQERNDVRAYLAEHDSLADEIELLERLEARRQNAVQSAGRQVAPAAAEPATAPLETAEDDDTVPAAPTRAQAAAAARQRGGGATAAAPTHVQTQHNVQPAHRLPRGTFGFRSMGEFAQNVLRAYTSNRPVDPRLLAAATTYGVEGVGADGGYLVPPEFRNQINSLIMAEDTLMSRTDNSPTDSNTVVVPTDEATPWGTSGVRVYTRGEAQAMTQSKPALKDITVKLNEIYAFVPVTDELLQDAPLLSTYLTTKAGDAINFAMNNYIINGNGVGQPLGILNSPALVTQPAEGSQIAGTIHAKNILNMWSRMPAGVRARAVWLINQDAEPQIMSMGMPVVSASSTTPVGGMPIYMPPGGLSASPYGTLLGRPVITTEACSQLGTVGDIIFAFLGGYFMPFKSGGVRSDISMHLFFDQGLTCFRWTFRVGGQPWLAAPIARKNGTNTLSHFVTLAAR